jgi:hypothetical protein
LRCATHCGRCRRFLGMARGWVTCETYVMPGTQLD